MSTSYRIRYDKAVKPSEDYPDGMPKGAEFDVEGKDAVSRYHPAATIVGTIQPDGTVAPMQASAAKDTTSSPKASPAKETPAPKGEDAPEPAPKSEAKKG